MRNRINTLRASMPIVAGLLMVMAQQVRGHEDPPGCAPPTGQGNTSSGGVNPVCDVAHVGDTIEWTASLGMVANACRATEATGTIYFPDGTSTNFLINVTLDPGVLITCPGNVLCRPGPYTYTIRAEDVGDPGVSPLCTFGGVPNIVQAVENGAGITHQNDIDGSVRLRDCHNNTVFIVNPCIDVTKECVYPQGQNCFNFGQDIAFRGTVRNCGNITLTNVTAVDSILGPLTLTDSNGVPMALPVRLNVGDTVFFGGSHPANGNGGCGPFTNSVMARGVDISACGGPRSVVTDIVTNICVVCNTPGIDVTKECLDPTVTGGQPVRYRFRVQNTGNVPLQNVRLVDDSFTPGIAGDDVTINVPGNLAPGAFFPSSGFMTNTVITSTSQCDGPGTITNTLVATGANVCNPAQTVTDTDRCSVRVECPVLRVYKQVVCYSNGVCEPFNPNLNTQKSAIGVRLDPPNAANCPAFCYRITVTNAGNVPLTLTVTDNSTPDPDLNLSNCGFPATLAAGASAQCVIPAVTHCENTLNVVTATGVSMSGTTVSARDTNNVTIRPIAITCILDVSTNGGASFFTTGANCPQVTLGNSYIVRVRTSNTGQHALQNVVVTTTGAPLCFATPLNLGGLAVGETRTNQCTFTCSELSTNRYSVSVSGEAGQSPDHVCDFNVQGQRLVARSTCEACVICAGVPGLQVYKQVVCYSNGVCEAFSPDLTTQKNAVGVRLDPPNAANCPAFCYRITVVNTGTLPLALTVTDNSTPDPDLNLSNCGFPATLAVGATAQCVIPAVSHCQNTLNVVTATGSSQGGNVTVRDTNNVIIRPIAITCILDVSTNGGASFFTTGANCPQVTLGNSYIVRVRTSNTGQHALQNVVVTTTGAPLCFATPLNLGGLAVGETRTNQCTFTCSELSTNRYSVSVSGEAAQSPDHICDFNVQGQRLVAQSTCEACVICAGVPGLRVYKQVVCYADGVCEAFNPDLNTQKNAIGVRLDPPNATNCPAFCYRITVVNTGTLPLALTVTDNSTPDPDLNLSNCGFPATLAVGATAQCVIPAVSHCQNTLNVVTATGSSQGGNVTVRDTNNVIIRPIAITCILDVSTNGGASFITPGKACSRVLVGNSYIVRVRTRNTGQHPLANVTVTTEGVPLCFTSPLNIGGLAVGETKTNQCTFTCSEPSTNRYSVSVVGEAAQSPDHVCDFNVQGQQLVARSSCVACVECVGPPDIEVIKEVACVLPGDQCGNFGKVATGVRDTACPAFCYRITIRNVGPVPIVTLTVTDPVLGTNISALFGPLPIAPGDTRTAIIKPIPHCVSITNTVRVVGRSADGQTDVDQDSAEVRVLNIHILCTITLSSTNDLDGNPNNAHVLLPGSGLVEFTLTLNNTGSSALNVVSLNGLPALVDCTTGAPVVPVLPINIGPGGSVTISACTAVTCPAGANYSVTARAEADDQNGTLCVYNRFGNRVTDETSCTALVECQPQAGCTPGFWKNCTIHWQPTGYTRGQSVNSVFSLGNCCGSLGSATLAGALEFGGGSDVCGGARILLRAAVAALLNASSPEVDYPFTTTEVINRVNAALHSCNRARIVGLAGELDRNNNLGCRGSDGNGLPCHSLTTP